MTLLVGLTGGMAAGKSEALSAFSEAGAETLSTDEIVHGLLATDAVRGALVERWGEDVLDAGEVDRAAVAERVFADPEELAWMEALLHPMVGREVAAWRARLADSVPIAVVEVPLLFESGMDEAFDTTVAVVTSEAERDRRLVERDGAATEGREGRQLSQEEKAERADHVIENDGSLVDLRSAVANLAAALSGSA